MFRQSRTQAFFRILPIENLKSRNRDRSLKENAPSGLRNRILTISDLKILNQNASGIFQYSLSQSPLWLLASKYSERILSQSSLWLCFQLPSLSLPCSSEPILTFQLQALGPISCIRMQTFSALNVRSHQRRKFSSLTFAYSDDHVLKLTGAQTFEFQPGPPSFFNPLYDAARDPPSESISWKGIQTLSTPNVCPV